MSFGITVKGGTGAGSKRPLLPANTIPWTCKCPRPSDTGWISENRRINPGYLKRCIDCGTSRDAST